MNRKLGVMIWVLWVVLINIVMFCITKEYTVTYWMTYIFMMIAFIFLLIFQLVLWHKKSIDGYLKMLPMGISYIYIVLQTLISIVIALMGSAISYKVALVLNATVLLVAWSCIIFSLIGNDHINKINKRQKDDSLIK